MSRHWIAKVAALTVAMGVVLAGCGGTKKETPAPAGTDSGTKQEVKFKAGMVTDVGGLNDESFNQAAWEGLTKAKNELAVDASAIESKRQDEYEPNYRTLIDGKNDLIWGIGYMMKDATAKVAKDNPNQKFAIIDEIVDATNVASVNFKEEEGSFLMGIIAAKATKTKKVGFVGGMDFDVIHHFDGGFYAGVKTIDPSIEVVRVYAAAFDDPVKGKNIAETMFKENVDVIFHAAGNTGTGVITAAKEQGKYAIGVDRDQNSLAPDNVLSSMMKRVDVAVFNITKMAKEGKFPGGTTTTLNLKDNGVGYAPKTRWDLLPAGTQALVDKYADAIKAGTFKVPAKYEAAKEFKAPSL